MDKKYIFVFSLARIHISHRVEWGKVGRFFGYFFDSVKNLDAMKDFMDYYGQCVSSLPLHKKIGPKKSCAGGVTPHFFLKGR